MSRINSLSEKKSLTFLTTIFVFLFLMMFSNQSEGLELLTSSYYSQNVLTYDAFTGAFLGSFVSTDPNQNGNLEYPSDIAVGPNNNLFVGDIGHYYDTNDPNQGRVLQYGTNGTYINDFVSSFGPNGTSDIANPIDLEFGNGYLYASNWVAGSVSRFDENTGLADSTFNTNQMNDSHLTNAGGIAFDSDGVLYVAESDGQNGRYEVLRFNATTGNYIDTFVSNGSGGLNRPYSMVFGPDGDLYVSSTDSGSNPPQNGGPRGEVLRYDGTTGASKGVFVSELSGGLLGPHGLSWGPDGNFYVASIASDEILRYDSSGTFIDAFITAGLGGLDAPVNITFAETGFGVTSTPVPEPSTIYMLLGSLLISFFLVKAPKNEGKE